MDTSCAQRWLLGLVLALFAGACEDTPSALEVSAEEQHRFSDPAFRERINGALRARGFSFVALDLEPFRSGRLNEAVGLPPAGAHS